MSIPVDQVIWMSGSNGHVARSTDAGKTWKWMVLEGYEKTDFRDIHAFDSATAIIMGIGNPAYLLKTTDGGQTWKLVYTKTMNGMFLDALDFRNSNEGICIGDPIDSGGRSLFFLIRTKDGGDTWEQERRDRCPSALQGEAVFSASGTNIALLDSKQFDYAFISGGLASNLYLIGSNGRPNKICPLRINKGKETTGAFSMATDRKSKFYCIGGDYKALEAVIDNFVWTTDNGKSWKTIDKTPPLGYRSCIGIIEGKRLVACGTNGVDVCSNPNDWKRISNEGFNVCMVTPNKKLIFFAGEKGKIGLLKL
jgi:photosystem II stability/assembly factor-like uncharacterized protein